MAGAWVLSEWPGREFCDMQTPAVGHSFGASHCQCGCFFVIPVYTALLASDASCHAQAPHPCSPYLKQEEQTRSCK